jgi:hypothetical protein
MQRATSLMGISLSWTTLARQLDRLAIIIEEGGKAAPVLPAWPTAPPIQVAPLGGVVWRREPAFLSDAVAIVWRR